LQDLGLLPGLCLSGVNSPRGVTVAGGAKIRAYLAG